MRRKHTTLRLVAATLAGLLVTTVPILQAAPAAAAGGPNLSLGKTAAVSSFTQTYVAGHINDGDQASYWESANGAFPQWAQVDLGSSTSIDQVILKLPSGWGTRSETLSLQSSPDGGTFSTMLASATYNFNGSTNTVTINFTATSTRFVRVTITGNSVQPGGQLSELEVYGTAGGGTGGTNLALGKTMGESGHNDVYPGGNANDGNQATYWESVNNAFPQWLRLDLGTAVSVTKVVLKIPAGWGARTETLSVQGSSNGTTFADIVGSTGYTFNGSTNTVTITFTGTTTRYVRLLVTANSVWPAGQISEFEVYGPSTGDTQAPTAPSGLALSAPASGQIKLTWNASTDNVGVTGYDIYRNSALITTVPATALTYTDAQPDTATVSYFVRAHDAAGNQSGNSNTVTRTGQTGGDTQAPTAPSNLVATTPTSGTVNLVWSASTDNVAVTGYDILRNGTQFTTVSGTTPPYNDPQPDTVTVMYSVRARDAAGNVSGASNTVTRTGSGGTGGGTNLAPGRAITGTPSTFTFVVGNANDNDVTTYFEGASYPTHATVSLLGNATLSSVVVKLNPDPSWGARTQTIAVLGQPQTGGAFVTLAGAQQYTFNPATGNAVTIPVSGSYQNIELSITQNSGAPGGQVAEFQIFGTPAPNPDLTPLSVTASPAAPIETDPITVSTTVRNIGTAASAASSVNVYLGTTKVGTTTVPAIAAGAQTVVATSIGTQFAGSYALTAKVDEANTLVELNDSNNNVTNGTNLVVQPVQSADLVPNGAWSPGNPSGGSTVTFTATVKNQGNIASGSGSHAVTMVVKDTNGTTVKSMSGSFIGSLAAGATSAVITLGTWTAVNGKYTVATTVAADPAELVVKQANNTVNSSFFVGQGANMPYDMYEAETGALGGGAAIVGPNRIIGDVAGEASNRKAVTLNSTGSSVSFTSRAASNTFVVRFSVPDGPDTTLDLYANGSMVQTLTLSPHFAWLYGNETGPSNTPGTGPRHIYDEAHFKLATSYPQGTVFKLQKDTANGSQYAIDFINLEQANPIANPDPAHYTVPNGFAQADVQAALDKVRTDTTGTWTGVYLPAGQYALSGKLLVYGKGVKVQGAGVWFTQFNAPAGQENTDVDWDLQTGASGSSFGGFAWFGNYDTRQDGPGHTWDLRNQSNITINDVWIEHQVVGVWGAANVQNSTFTNMRIRDTMADGINLTNGSQGNLISNDEARTTGDDSFALFAAQDQNPGELKNNTIQNVTALTPWRAAGLAIYGGYANTIQNFYIADTLCYSGLTISSLNFGFSFEGFGATPPTTFSNFSLARDGGHFWGQQVFGAIWVFSATNIFQGIRVNDATITDPTYSGIMFQTDYSGPTNPLFPVADTIFTNTTITGAQKSGDAFDAKSGFGIWANPLPEPGQGPAVGTVTFNHLVESNNFRDIENTTSTFHITVNP